MSEADERKELVDQFWAMPDPDSYRDVIKGMLEAVPVATLRELLDSVPPPGGFLTRARARLGRRAELKAEYIGRFPATVESYRAIIENILDTMPLNLLETINRWPV